MDVRMKARGVRLIACPRGGSAFTWWGSMHLEPPKDPGLAYWDPMHAKKKQTKKTFAKELLPCFCLIENYACVCSHFGNQMCSRQFFFLGTILSKAWCMQILLYFWVGKRPGLEEAEISARKLEQRPHTHTDTQKGGKAVKHARPAGRMCRREAKSLLAFWRHRLGFQRL